ncbi:PucR family transcriptional regulator [Paenibacillus ginsengarvi]|uniref:PucR family transcriptional regulator n=1 Tax=Paenibacillus ginsengarvi TaxID=400777 RepID=UPI001F00EA22|nr:helix-turn-helix domain-containing protein [Paenibacillus ginsengarvi]
MVQWDRIIQQLEHILGTEFRLERLPVAKWNRNADDAKSADKSRTIEGRNHFLLYKDGGHLQTASVEEAALTISEKQLVELMLEAQRMNNKHTMTSAHSEDERKAGVIRAWVADQLEQGITDTELPETITRSFPLYASKIPLLVYGDYSDQRKAAYQDLKKLLESFFDGEIALIPLLDKEWLVLGPESLLHESGDGDEETMEEMLASLGQALHEMLATEWVGECHVAVDYPMLPAKSLLASIYRLRETMSLGRTYHVADNIHMPWRLQLEKLLQPIGEEQRQQFLERVLKRVDLLKEAEMITTLEQFITLDCSVSETAKKLFIHRNTLLYRLDKFKQETGLDVRTFHHALLVHVALLLYKVTKRT